MFEDSNQSTQPLTKMQVFNNWEVIPEAWFCVGEIKSLDQGITSVSVGNQRLVLFKTQNGDIHCLDEFCSHMGLSLSLGEVVGEKIRCQFHHYQFSGNGMGEKPNCEKLKDNQHLRSYPVTIRYGLIWIWSGKSPAYSLPSHPDFSEHDYDWKLGELYSRPSHPHISLLNALDIQHVNTVHALELKVTSQHFESEDKSFIHYDFQGTFNAENPKGKRSAYLSGGGYSYSVRYAGSTVGFLKALQGIRLLGKIPFPPIYATFGYRQAQDKRTYIQPIFLTKKRKGIIGRIKSSLHLWFTELIYNRLKNEDGSIYENIRFTPHFTQEDSNIISFVAHVNRLVKSDFQGLK